MPPKKHSGFMMFVNEWRDNNPEGRNLSISQAVTRCGSIWDKMSAQQRGPYNSEAKNADVVSRVKKERLNCHGQVLSQVELEEREMAESKLHMKRCTERIVMDAKRSHDLESTKFVFVAFNYFTKALTSDVYVPAEFSATEYSLNDGIKSVYSTLIDPGQIIFGQGSDAQHHSSTTHNLPLPPNALGEKNMGKLFRNILEYLSQSKEGKDANKPLVVFTKTDLIPVVKSCFRYLACESQDRLYESGDQIQVLDIQYLFFILKKEVLDTAGLPDDKINLYVTDAYFSRDFFEFTPEIACQYHEENDRSKYCTQSLVKRWAYTFSDYMCRDLAISVQPGKHIPPKTKPNYRVIPADSSVHESSFDSFHSFPVSREKKDDSSAVLSPASSRRSLASSSYVPTDHTSFVCDLNKKDEFPSLGGRRTAKGRNGAQSSKTMGSWNLPAHTRSLRDFSDDDFSVSSTRK
ncbi:protein maelstrom 2 [Drosophila bipectinata]|uniref:protein maelstrom 2 n=1 Tax=Drosophila bipectinata TaxID=42026 RepID=UPI001C8AD3C0|nr:protein maelstrom 2 [Drosophila bipectinata]XP_017093274.2 protein maelstrom 2 [Drosophila bipectinata]